MQDEKCSICQLTLGDIDSGLVEDSRNIKNIKLGVQRLPDHRCNLFYHYRCVDAIKCVCPYCRKKVKKNVEDFKLLFDVPKINIIEEIDNNNIEKIKEYLDIEGYRFLDADENTLLHLAKNSEQVSLFLEAGCRNVKNKKCVYPLDIFIKKGDLESVKLIFQNMQEDERIDQIQSLADAAFEGHFDIVEYLIQNGVEFNDSEGEVFKMACSGGHFDIVSYLVSKGVDIHIDSEAPLRIACQQGHLEIVKYLVDIGADINAEECEDEYCRKQVIGGSLFHASKYGNLDVVKFLFGKNPTMTQQSKSFFIASKFGNLDVLKFFIENGVDVNCHKYSLISACDGGHDDVVKYLIESGIDIRSGGEAFLKACRNRNLEMMNYLEQSGVDIKNYVQEGLNISCVKGNIEIVKFLVERGADPFQLIKKGDDKITEYLMIEALTKKGYIIQIPENL